MRFSPILLASIALSTGVGLASAAQASVPAPLRQSTQEPVEGSMGSTAIALSSLPARADHGRADEGNTDADSAKDADGHKQSVASSTSPLRSRMDSAIAPPKPTALINGEIVADASLTMPQLLLPNPATEMQAALMADQALDIVADSASMVMAADLTAAATEEAIAQLKQTSPEDADTPAADEATPDEVAPDEAAPADSAISDDEDDETDDELEVDPDSIDEATEAIEPVDAPESVDAPEPGPNPFDTFGESEEEARVLIIDVNVVGVDDRPELVNEVYRTLQTRPGQTATESQLQDDINAIFATGFFSSVQAGLEDTPLGVRLTLAVTPNPILRSVTLEDSVLADDDTLLEFGGDQFTVDEVVDAIFAPQYGRTLNRVPPEFTDGTLNLGDFQAGINELYDVYSENGYVLAQVVDADISPSGDVTLVMAEGIIEDIEVQFLDDDGFAEDEEGNPIDGRTRDFIITREFSSQPGDVFNQSTIQQDLQQVFGLGIFDDVRVALNPGDDPRKVDVIVNVIESNTGSIAAGAGFSSASGFFGSASYQQQNLGGNNQRLGTEIQIGQRELLFDVRFTDPWIATDPYRTSYTVNTFLRRSISLIFDGGEREVDLCEVRNDFNCDQDDLEDGDRPRVQRLGGGISFSRPLDEWLGWENWRASTGFQYQRVSIRDGDGDLSFIDALGNRLSFSESGRDDLFTLQLAAVRDLRNNPQQPTSGSLLRFGTEQSIPIGNGTILMNRLRASYSHYVPADITNFNDGPEAFAFNVQAGTVLGDLPPYEAFSLGGTDSVRGYDAGELGSGRSFVQATAEYRFPLFSIVGGALFLDFGSDLGTAGNVPGSPANVREKPGTGFGYGLGVRVQSPLGQIRVDYGINDDGDGRIHFGIGERF